VDKNLYVCLLQIWARGCRPYDADLRDLEYYEESWGSGLEINTKLINAAGEVTIYKIASFNKNMGYECFVHKF